MDGVGMIGPDPAAQSGSLPIRASIRFFLLAVLCLGVILLAGCAPEGSETSNPLFSRNWLNFQSQSKTNPSVTAESSTVPGQPLSPTRQARLSAVPSLSPKTTQTATPVKLAPVSAADLKGLRILLLHPWPGATAQAFQSLVDEFNQSNTWGVFVDTAAPGSSSEVSNWMEDALGGLPSGPSVTPSPPGMTAPVKNIPDIVVADPVQAQAWQAVPPGLVSVSGYLHDPTWGIKAQEAADLAPNNWFGAPAQESTFAFFYNQTWAKSLGFSQPPATLDDFRQQACKAAQANRYDADPQRRGTGGWLISSDPLSMAGWIEAFGGQLKPGSGGRYVFDTPQSSQAFQYLKGLEDAGCAWLGRDPQPYDYFAGREALFYLGSLDDLTDQASAMQRAGKSDQWTVIPFPTQSDKPFAMTDNTYYYLVKSSPSRQLAAWLFIHWMLAPQQQLRWIKVLGTFPVGQSAATVLSGYRSSNPQWSAAFDLLPGAHPQPDQASWAVDGGVLSDGAQQIFQTDTQDSAIPDILEQIDQTTLEIQQRSP